MPNTVRTLRIAADGTEIPSPRGYYDRQLTQTYQSKRMALRDYAERLTMVSDSGLIDVKISGSDDDPAGPWQRTEFVFDSGYSVVIELNIDATYPSR